MGKLVFEFSKNELAIRIVGAVSGGIERPPGLTPKELLEQMPPDVADDAMKMATAAAEYFHEVIRNSQEVQ
jgi:hypothetical protein